MGKSDKSSYFFVKNRKICQKSENLSNNGKFVKNRKICQTTENLSNGSRSNNNNAITIGSNTKK